MFNQIDQNTRGYCLKNFFAGAQYGRYTDIVAFGEDIALVSRHFDKEKRHCQLQILKLDNFETWTEESIGKSLKKFTVSNEGFEDASCVSFV